MFSMIGAQGIEFPYKFKTKTEKNKMWGEEKKRDEKHKANWATLWKYLNMSRILPLAQ